MDKRMLALSALLVLCLCLTACKTTKKNGMKKDAKTSSEHVQKKKAIRWSTIRREISRKAKQEKGDDYDELVGWVVEEVHKSYPQIPDQKQLVQQNKLSPKKYKAKKKEELDELVIWVIGEVKTKLKNDKYIITKEDVIEDEEKPKFEY